MRSKAGPTLTPVSTKLRQISARTTSLALLRPAQREAPFAVTFPLLASLRGGEHPARSRDLSDRRAHDAFPLQRAGDTQRQVLAPGRGDELHADRQRLTLRPDGNRDHGQADEGYRLREQAEMRTHEHLFAVEEESALTDSRRPTRRRRGDEYIDLAKQF